MRPVGRPLPEWQEAGSGYVRSIKVSLATEENRIFPFGRERRRTGGVDYREGETEPDETPEVCVSVPEVVWAEVSERLG
jgi:hypothetical protein